MCLTSAFHTTKAALPGMLAGGWGRIINTGSMHALVASPYKSAYNAAKHGIAGARSARRRLQGLFCSGSVAWLTAQVPVMPVRASARGCSAAVPEHTWRTRTGPPGP